METVVLNAETREQRGSSAVHKLRQQGKLPATVYGMGQEPVALTVSARDLNDLLRAGHGANVLVDLKIPGQSHAGSVAAMIREVQRHPVRRDLLHVDFQWVSLREKVIVKVPIHVEGDAPGLKEGGALDQVLHEIEVECLPGAIPDALVVDITGMGILDSKHVSDLVAPEGVAIHHEPSDAVVTIAPPISMAALETQVAEVEEGAGEETASEEE